MPTKKPRTTKKKVKEFAPMKKIVATEEPAPKKQKKKAWKDMEVKVWLDENGKVLPAKCQTCDSVKNCGGDHFKMMKPSEANTLAGDNVFKALEPQSINGILAVVVVSDGRNYWR